MATGHFITAKGAVALMNGDFDDNATWKVLLLSGAAAPAALDTLAEVSNVNFVTDLLALTGVDECTGTGYARKAITPGTIEENDTSDRADLPVDAVLTYTAADFGDVYAAVFFLDTGDDSTATVVSIDIFATPITTNTGDFTYTMADVYRATPA
ncbi:MAG: hypothetical protein AB7O86_05845 [Porticoccaceae bacterium]